MVKIVCVALKVDDLKAVLRELGGPISGTRALLLERILCHAPGYKHTAVDPREALGTGAGRRPVLATPRQLIPADAETLVLTSKSGSSDGETGAPTFALPAMEGKDLLTGDKLAKKPLQISRANDAFYDAYESANLKAMSRIWGKAPHVKCCHPGRRFVIGERAAWWTCALRTCSLRTHRSEPLRLLKEGEQGSLPPARVVRRLTDF